MLTILDIKRNFLIYLLGNKKKIIQLLEVSSIAGICGDEGVEFVATIVCLQMLNMDRDKGVLTR